MYLYINFLMLCIRHSRQYLYKENQSQNPLCTALVKQTPTSMKKAMRFLKSDLKKEGYETLEAQVQNFNRTEKQSSRYPENRKRFGFIFKTNKNCKQSRILRI